MPAKRKKERVVGRYFIWLLGQRSGVFYADGRSNRPTAGRHSLGCSSHEGALKAIQELDLTRAVALGLCAPAVLQDEDSVNLNLEDGRRLYLEYVRRPRVVGGARPTTPKRYRAVLDKFEQFAAHEGIRCWQQIDAAALRRYAAHLDERGYAYRTQYLELTCLKQVNKHLVKNGHLPAKRLIKLPLPKPSGTSTYCWRPEEIRAMREWCTSQPGLHWLGNAITALTCTGLRISESHQTDRRNNLDAGAEKG
jgi:hypothetical protein